MENIVREYMDKFGKDRTHKRRYACLLGVLALLVCLAVFWRLKLVGTAMTNEAACGLQEHTHTDECYEDVLVCDIATGETADGAEHEHTADCYQRQLVCNIPEHTHTPDCYSDAEADTETEADWAASFPQEALTGDWAQDTVLVAASQAGYTESTRNWQLADDGTRRGYTRYGAWYGNPYGDWNGMFAAFCLHYAGVDDTYLTAENAAGVNAWAVSLFNAGEWQGPDHEAVPGDVVFFGSDDKIESCAVVTDVYEENGVPTLSVLAGDVDNTVAELTIPTDSDSILGYAATADAYAAYEADHPANDTEDEQTEETAEDGQADTLEAREEEDNRLAVVSNTDDGLNLTSDTYVKGMQGGTETEGSAIYEGGDTFRTAFEMELNIPKADLVDNNYKAYFELPDNIRITNGLLDKGDISIIADTKVAGKYRFVNVDGKNRIVFEFDKDYVDSLTSGASVHIPSLSFTAEAGATEVSDDSKVTFVFSDTVKCTVPAKWNKGDETLDYQVSTKKTGKLSEADKTLSYTATVTSTKGTPDLTVTDTLTGIDQLGVSACRIKSIKKIVDGQTETLNPADYPFTVTEGNKQFTLKLPGLPKPKDSSNPNHYEIEYEYVLEDIDGKLQNAKVTARNTLKAEGEGKKEPIKSETSYDVTIDRTLLSKSYWKEGSKIHWTVAVNGSHQNIANRTVDDRTLKDSFFGQLTKADLTITGKGIGADGKEYDVSADELGKTYDIQVDENQKVTGILFKVAEEGKENTNSYTIQYTTEVDPSMSDQLVTNSASMGGDAKSDVTANVGGQGGIAKNPDSWNLDGVAGQTVEIPWTVTITPVEKDGKKVIPARTNFVDTIEDNGHYMTYAQAQAFKQELETKGFGGCYENLAFGYNGTSYTAENLPKDAKITSISFTVSQNIAVNGDVQLKYSTTADGKDVAAGSTVYVKNKITAGDKSAEPGVNVRYLGAKKLTVQEQPGTLNDKDDTFMWAVQLYCNADSTGHTYYLADTLPENVELVNIYVGQSMYWGKIKDDKSDAKWSAVNGALVKDNACPGDSEAQKFEAPTDFSINGQKVALTVKKPTTYTQDHFFVVYECKLKESYWDSLDTKATLSLTNTVEVKRDGKDFGTPESTLKVDVNKEEPQKELLTKVGKWTGWQDNQSWGNMEYTLTINPDAEKLLEGETGTLTLEDTLDKGYFLDAELQLDSLELRDANTNEPLAKEEWPVAYDSANRKLTITLPDERALKLTYTYRVRYTGDVVWNKDDNDVVITNSAILKGFSETSTSDKNTLKWEKQESTATVSGTYTITKVDGNNMSVVLPNAKFRVYAYDKNSKTFIKTDRLYETDGKGRFMVQMYKDNIGLNYNRAYYIEEEEAPDGYEKPAQPQKLYFYFGSGNKTLHPDNMPQGFIDWYDGQKAVDLIKNSKQAIISNVRIKTDLTIRKVWADDTPENQIQAVNVTVKSITVPLDEWNVYYNQSRTLEDLKQAYADTIQPVTTVSVTAGTDRTLYALPVVAKNATDTTPETRYIYYVEEEVPSGFKSDVDIIFTNTGNAEEPLSDYTFTITNTPTTSYELPKTGGRGTLPYMAGGLALMAVSLLCAIYQKRKREGRQND